MSSDKYANPAELPRYPTIIRDAADLPGTGPEAPPARPPGYMAPPPKFPSMVDVALPRADAVARANAAEAQLVAEEEARRDAAAGAGAGFRRVGSREIAAEAARNRVEPGTGERRAREARERAEAEAVAEAEAEAAADAEAVAAGEAETAAEAEAHARAAMAHERAAEAHANAAGAEERAKGAAAEADSFRPAHEDMSGVELGDEGVTDSAWIGGAGLMTRVDSEKMPAVGEYDGELDDDAEIVSSSSNSDRGSAGDTQIETDGEDSDSDAGGKRAVAAAVVGAPVAAAAAAAGATASKLPALQRSAAPTSAPVVTDNAVADGDSSWIGGGVALTQAQRREAEEQAVQESESVHETPVAPPAAMQRGVALSDDEDEEDEEEPIMHDARDSLVAMEPLRSQQEEAATADRSTGAAGDDAPKWARNPTPPIAAGGAAVEAAASKKEGEEDDRPEWAKNSGLVASRAKAVEESRAVGGGVADEMDDNVPEWARKPTPAIDVEAEKGEPMAVEEEVQDGVNIDSHFMAKPATTATTTAAGAGLASSRAAYLDKPHEEDDKDSDDDDVPAWAKKTGLVAAGGGAAAGAAALASAARNDDEEEAEPEWVQRSRARQNAEMSAVDDAQARLASAEDAAEDETPEWAQRSLNRQSTEMPDEEVLAKRASLRAREEDAPDWVKNRPVLAAAGSTSGTGLNSDAAFASPSGDAFGVERGPSMDDPAAAVANTMDDGEEEETPAEVSAASVSYSKMTSDLWTPASGVVRSGDSYSDMRNDETRATETEASRSVMPTPIVAAVPSAASDPQVDEAVGEEGVSSSSSEASSAGKAAGATVPAPFAAPIVAEDNSWMSSSRAVEAEAKESSESSESETSAAAPVAATVAGATALGAGAAALGSRSSSAVHSTSEVVAPSDYSASTTSAPVSAYETSTSAPMSAYETPSPAPNAAYAMSTPATSTTSMAEPRKPATSSAGYQSLLPSVPVTSAATPTQYVGGEDVLVQSRSDAEAASHTDQELIRAQSKSSAHVNVTRDFGLVGGHQMGVNDAAFLDCDTLITAGADGKVCVWDMNDRYVKSEFVPYEGEPVTMLHVLPTDDDTTSSTIMTMSAKRVMRIWNTTEDRAVLLRSMQIPPSNNDLVMSVPVITPQMRKAAAEAARAASVESGTPLNTGSPKRIFGSGARSIFSRNKMSANKVPA